MNSQATFAQPENRSFVLGLSWIAKAKCPLTVGVATNIQLRCDAGEHELLRSLLYLNLRDLYCCRYWSDLALENPKL